MVCVLTAVKIKFFFFKKGPDSRVRRRLPSNLHFGKKRTRSGGGRVLNIVNMERNKEQLLSATAFSTFPSLS